MRKKRQPISYIDALRKLAHAGLHNASQINGPRAMPSDDEPPSLEDRVASLLGIVNRPERPATHMIFFVMYDIESNKVRRLVAKYLIGKGCTRIQRSIFLADLPSVTFNEIKSDLAEVQSLYENHDSIIVCPISTEQIGAMHVIGKQVDIDIITHRLNTLFY